MRCFRGMPDTVGFSLIAEKIKKFNIHGLLIVGGFEVSHYAVCLMACVSVLTSSGDCTQIVLSWLGGVTVACWTGDHEVAGFTSGSCIA